ncbi:MAG: hypothetical protein GTO24_16655 [candidate division Zixibacteria bacterium]|nr:hypothetical protein [candidate division Zixibacteria bacterium]
MITTLKVGGWPSALAHNPANNQIYCTDYGSDEVTIIDGVGDSVRATLKVGLSPSALAYNSGNNKIYCANRKGSSVSVIACAPPTVTDLNRKNK